MGPEDGVLHTSRASEGDGNSHTWIVNARVRAPLDVVLRAVDRSATCDRWDKRGRSQESS